MNIGVFAILGGISCMGQRLSRRSNNTSILEARMAQMREENGRRHVAAEITEARWRQCCREGRQREAARKAANAREVDGEEQKEPVKSSTTV